MTPTAERHPLNAARRGAAFFDLDKTIIATSSSMALSRPLLNSGLLSRRTLARSAYAQLGYLLVGAGPKRTERMKDARHGLQPVGTWRCSTESSSRR